MAAESTRFRQIHLQWFGDDADEHTVESLSELTQEELATKALAWLKESQGQNRRLRTVESELKEIKEASGSQSEADTKTALDNRSTAVRLQEMQKVLNMQSRALERAEKGELSPSVAMRIAQGVQEESDLDSALDAVIADIDAKVEARVNENLVNNGTVPRSGDPGGAITRDEINRMTKAEVARMPDDLVNEIMGATE